MSHQPDQPQSHAKRVKPARVDLPKGRPEKKPEKTEIVALRTDLDKLTRNSFEAFDWPMQLMLTIRILYEQPQSITLLCGADTVHMKGLLTTAIDHIRQHDLSFRQVQKTENSRAKFFVTLASLTESGGDLFDRRAQRFSSMFGSIVSEITQHMARASYILLLSQRTQAIIAGEEAEPVRKMLKKALRSEGDYPEAQIVIKDTFCELCHKRDIVLARGS